MRLPLEDLLKTFPVSSFDSSIDGHRAISEKPATTFRYIWPDVLQEQGDQAASEGPIVLISAPGAMGKTEAAKNIAVRLKSIYVDLSKIQVGNGSLIGELVKAVGPIRFASLQTEIREGRAVLVLDSTDEAQLRSGFGNFSEFLKDIREFVAVGDTTPRVIFLGRSDSIRATQGALKELGYDAPHFELQALDRNQANAFIEATLDSPQSEYSLHQNQPEPFSRLRDKVLSNLARALLTNEIGPSDLDTYWESVESFLGYPPVLLALAERLKVSNPQQEVSEISAASEVVGRRQRGELLKDIVEHILKRESKKVQVAMGEKLAISPSDPARNSLYGPDEQVARLLALTGTQGVIMDRPTLLKGDERESYDRQVESFVKEHPFIRDAEFANDVFSDYVSAWAVSAPHSQLFASSRPQFLATLPRTGPFFARFVAALTPEGTKPSMPEDLVDVALKSYLNGSSSAKCVFRHRTDHQPTLRLFDEDSKLADEEITFEITESSGVLSLRSPLARSVILSDHGVMFVPGMGGQIDLGSDCLILANEIETPAKTIRVLSNSENDSPAVIIAVQSMTHEKDLKIHTYRPKSLVVDWPDAWHQWKPYLAPIGSKSRRIDRSVWTQVIVSVRKLLLSFNPALLGGPAVSADRVDRVLVSGNEIASATLAGLVELGVVWKDDGQYRLDLERLSGLGLHWQIVRSNDPENSLADISRSVIETEAFQLKLGLS